MKSCITCWYFDIDLMVCMVDHEARCGDKKCLRILDVWGGTHDLAIYKHRLEKKEG